MSRITLRNLLWLATGAFWLFLFVMTHIPQGEGPEMPTNDKFNHFIAYGLLAGLLYACLWVADPASWRPLWLVPLVCAGYGAVDEWLQAIPFIRRSCELRDWVADVVGALIAVAVLSLIKLAYDRARRPAPEGVTAPS